MYNLIKELVKLNHTQKNWRESLFNINNLSYLYTNSILHLSIRSVLDRLYLSDIPLSGHFIYISNTAHLSSAYFIQLSPSSGYVSHIPFPGSYFRTIRTIKNVTRDQLADFLSIRITNQKVHYLTNNRWMQQFYPNQ